MIIAEVVRSGIVESEHRGTVAVIDANGAPLAGYGDIARSFLLRSVGKPIQAMVASRLGASLPPTQTALSVASHDGHPVHLALVERILADGGLLEDDLECPPARPASSITRRVAGPSAAPRRLWHNCSGKHAAMLRACIAQGWPTNRYSTADHPLQSTIADAFETSIGHDGGFGQWGVDGCGAPVPTVNAIGIARLMQTVIEAGGPIVEAMMRYPALIGGSRHIDWAVMVGIHSIAKRGAEATFGCAIRGRGAVGIKIWDGDQRAVGPVLYETLAQLGWIPQGGRAALDARTRSPVLGGGTEVGTVRSAFRLEPL